MVKGIEIFREYFSEYTDQYVLIGGVACDISFKDSDLDFRATRDLDVVLLVEAQTKEFGQRFWDFIKEGKYRNRAKSNGEPQFYRFDKPEVPGYPSMIELFSRSSWMIEQDAVLTPVHIDDSVSSLSAILLNDEYYELLLAGKDVIDGLSILKPTWLVPFKAKAWLDLNEKLEHGAHVDSRDIKKHRNDIIRITTELVLESCELSDAVKKDMSSFVEKLRITDAELKNLHITGIHETDIIQVLKSAYHLQ
jgi:hypothetical protein